LKGRMVVQIVTARSIGLVFIGGIVTTGLGFYFSQPSRLLKEEEKEKEIDDLLVPIDDSFYNEIYDDINENKVKVDEFPPDFRIVIHGGAGVVSKGIDSKPFFESLTRIMADAYKYAKVGKENVTGTIFEYTYVNIRTVLILGYDLLISKTFKLALDILSHAPGIYIYTYIYIYIHIYVYI
jgi:hypothetical protein